MKGLFIPEITAEMFRNGCLESIEALMAEGEMYDIDYEPRWIPVTERLPDDETDILVTYANGEETRIVPVNYGRDKWFDCLFDRELNPHMITAWMPLPEPYERSEDA